MTELHIPRGETTRRAALPTRLVPCTDGFAPSRSLSCLNGLVQQRVESQWHRKSSARDARCLSGELQGSPDNMAYYSHSEGTVYYRDDVALFLNQFLRNGRTWAHTPYQKEYLASAVASAVRVVIHEHTHALCGRRSTPTSRPYAVLIEGVTELTARLLLPQILDEAGVTRALPQVTAARVTPVYVKYTLLAGYLFEAAAHLTGESPGALISAYMRKGADGVALDAMMDRVEESPLLRTLDASNRLRVREAILAPLHELVAVSQATSARQELLETVSDLSAAQRTIAQLTGCSPLPPPLSQLGLADTLKEECFEAPSRLEFVLNGVHLMLGTFDAWTVPGDELNARTRAISESSPAMSLEQLLSASTAPAMSLEQLVAATPQIPDILASRRHPSVGSQIASPTKNLSGGGKGHGL